MSVLLSRRQRKILGETIRDRVRVRLPRTLAAYQRWVRPRITGERRHIEFADWVVRGERIVGELGAVGVQFDRDGVWIEDPAGFRWNYRPGLFGSAMWAEYGEEYERGETDLLQSLLPADGVLIDVGANVGLHAIKLARRIPGLRVFAFEPVASTIQSLRMNARKNQVEQAIDAHRVALSDHVGELRLTTAFRVGNFVVPGTADAAGEAFETVPCRRLDDAIDQLTDRLDVIKCDVEGSELAVLRGAAASLGRFRPALFVEIMERYTRRYGHRAADVFDYLHGLGYRHELVIQGGRRPATESVRRDLTQTTNFLFTATD